MWAGLAVVVLAQFPRPPLPPLPPIPGQLPGQLPSLPSKLPPLPYGEGDLPSPNCTTPEAVDCVLTCSNCTDNNRLVFSDECSSCFRCIQYVPCVVPDLPPDADADEGGKGPRVSVANIPYDPLSHSAGMVLLLVICGVLLLILLVALAATLAGYKFMKGAAITKAGEMPSSPASSPHMRARKKIHSPPTLEIPFLADRDRNGPSSSRVGREVGVSFENIRYYVNYKGVKRQILDDVTGYLRSGCFTAIMGPSGSGKTTLLNLLSGRARVGEFSGVRKINGRARDIEKYNEFMKRQGYVLQEDLFFEELTVRQSLTFSTALKLGSSEAAAVEARVEELVADCKLRSCADTRIG
eukprot:Hpha_TRINITY_DN31047_c0_g1::TRINITY_DN31047_c0_g1_i1::g.64043::m.64043